MPRPSKLTGKLHTFIVGYVRTGVSIPEAARASGVSKVAVYNWLRKGQYEEKGIYHKFYEEMETAKASVVVGHMVTVAKLSKEGHLGAATWALERLNPERYGRNAKLHIEIEAQIQEVLDVVYRVADPETRERIFAAIAEGPSSADADPGPPVDGGEEPTTH